MMDFFQADQKVSSSSQNNHPLETLADISPVPFAQNHTALRRTFSYLASPILSVSGSCASPLIIRLEVNTYPNQHFIYDKDRDEKLYFMF
jgi:hypothetical protein